MALQDLVIFDTSTLPEYYNDVHTILALPAGFVVTYDYSARNISDGALQLLRAFKTAQPVRAVLAYVQPETYEKGAASDATGVLPAPTIQTLTRLARVIDVREVNSDTSVRYYIDLELRGYPYDPNRTIANGLVKALRASGEMPMKTYVAIYPTPSSDALFSQRADEQAFSQVVDALSAAPSQFSKDTFWRLTKISYQTKSLIPLWTRTEVELTPKTDESENRSFSYLDVVDQSSLHFHIQFHRGREEHGITYRIRRISVEGSPKSSSDLVQSSFLTRSFGQEIVAISIPATSSLSVQDVRFQIVTTHHERDEQKDYPYGPQLSITVRYRKDFVRSSLAILALSGASGLFAWAGFATSILTANPVFGSIAPIECRVLSVVIGVLASLYAYYLWTDEVTLDKGRRT